MVSLYGFFYGGEPIPDLRGPVYAFGVERGEYIGQDVYLLVRGKPLVYEDAFFPAKAQHAAVCIDLSLSEVFVGYPYGELLGGIFERLKKGLIVHAYILLIPDVCVKVC